MYPVQTFQFMAESEGLGFVFHTISYRLISPYNTVLYSFYLNIPPHGAHSISILIVY